MIYVASKVKHAAMWRQLRDDGLPINATWIDKTPVSAAEYRETWVQCIKEASQAHVTIVYAEPGEVLKGAFAEAGAALACGRQVLWVNPDPSWSVVHHPLSRKCAHLGEALMVATVTVFNSSECEVSSENE